MKLRMMPKLEWPTCPDCKLPVALQAGESSARIALPFPPTTEVEFQRFDQLCAQCGTLVRKATA
jgi:hypothetical protein